MTCVYVFPPDIFVSLNVIMRLLLSSLIFLPAFYPLPSISPFSLPHHHHHLLIIPFAVALPLPTHSLSTRDSFLTLPTLPPAHLILVFTTCSSTLIFQFSYGSSLLVESLPGAVTTDFTVFGRTRSAFQRVPVLSGGSYRVPVGIIAYRNVPSYTAQCTTPFSSGGQLALAGIICSSGCQCAPAIPSMSQLLLTCWTRFQRVLSSSSVFRRAGTVFQWSLVGGSLCQETAGSD